MTNFHGALGFDSLRYLRTTQEHIQWLQGRCHQVEQRLGRIGQRLSALDVRLVIVGDNLAQQQRRFLSVTENIKQGDAWP